MAFATGLQPSQALSLLQQRFIALRNALHGLDEAYGWTSGLTQADMETATGLGAGDANTMLAACADGNAVSQMLRTGLPPASYPQPTSAYVYLAAMRQVIGPLP